MKKVQKINITLTIIMVALVGELGCLAPYQNPQITNTRPFQMTWTSQILGTSKFVVQALHGGTERLYLFDALAEDFPSVQYHQSLVAALTGMRKTRTHPENPDIIFVLNQKLYLCSLTSVLKTSTEPAVNLSDLGLLLGTNFLFTGGWSGWMHRFDYTSDPLTPQVSSNFANPENIRTINLLEGDQPSTESAWATDNGKLFFVDRTTLSSATRTYQDATNIQQMRYLHQFLTPKKLVFLENPASDDMGVIDYSQTTITRDYLKKPCGGGVAASWLAPLDHSTKGILVCDNQYIKLLELSDGTELKNLDVNGVHAKGKFGQIIQNRRIMFVHGETSTAGTFRISLWDVRDEVPCHSSCKTCEFDATTRGCTSCPAPKVLRLDGSCADTCAATDEYVDGSSKCQKCDSTRLTCFTGGPNGCSTCPNPKYKRSNNSCKDNCTSNEYHAGSKICQACDPSCLTCSAGGPSSCLTCPDPKFKRTDNSCQESCASNEFYIGIKICVTCHPTCTTCRGPSPSNCLSCDSQNYYYLKDNKQCHQCTREACPRCPKDSLCESCQQNLSLSGCPRLIDYSISLDTREDGVNGENSIYLLVKLNSTNLKTDDLQFMIDYEHFLIEASTIEFVGSTSYDNHTNLLCI